MLGKIWKTLNVFDEVSLQIVYAKKVVLLWLMLKKFSLELHLNFRTDLFQEFFVFTFQYVTSLKNFCLYDFLTFRFSEHEHYFECED